MLKCSHVPAPPFPSPIKRLRFSSVRHTFSLIVILSAAQMRRVTRRDMDLALPVRDLGAGGRFGVLKIRSIIKINDIH